MKQIVPKRYQAATLKASGTDLTERLAQFIRESPGECLILCGPPGAGKTHAIWGLFNDMAALPPGFETHHGEKYYWRDNPEKKSVRVIDTDFFLHLQWAPFDEKEGIIREVEVINVLCIDDLGQETHSEQNMVILQSIINARYQNQRTTIIATNLPIGRFLQVYGDRMRDRLIEWGQCYETNAESRRRRE